MGKGQASSWVGWKMAFWQEVSLYAYLLNHLWGEESPPDTVQGAYSFPHLRITWFHLFPISPSLPTT